MIRKSLNTIVYLFFGLMLGAFIPVIALSEAVTIPESHKSLKGFQMAGPYSHENLSVFLIKGKNTLSGKSFMTLEEALDSKMAVLYETGTVSKLSIENLSAEKHIYIQAGDIVKGGKQDRVISIDIVIKPKSGKVPISAFCVEKGRWSTRQGEAVDKFSSSKAQLNSKKLKLAAKSGKSQGEVWREVANSQNKLKDKIGRSVKSGRSESSLQLTLEHKALKKAVSNYTETLSPIINEHQNAVGYAFAINGEFNSCDIYGDSALFKKLWPKLLKSSATEAVAAFEKGKTYSTPTIQAIEQSLKDALNGKQSEKQVGQRTKMVTHESEKNVLYDTLDMDSKGTEYINRNIIKK